MRPPTGLLVLGLWWIGMSRKCLWMRFSFTAWPCPGMRGPNGPQSLQLGRCQGIRRPQIKLIRARFRPVSACGKQQNGDRAIDKSAPC